MSAPGNKMVLKEIYEWFENHTDKAKDPKSKGWQNSIRHNLSMNGVCILISHTCSRLTDFRHFVRRNKPHPPKTARETTFGFLNKVPLTLVRCSPPPGTENNLDTTRDIQSSEHLTNITPASKTAALQKADIIAIDRSSPL